MSRVGSVRGANVSAGVSTGFSPIKRSGGTDKIGPIDVNAPQPERSLDEFDAPTIDEELSASLFEEVSARIADPSVLRPAGVKAILEELQRDLADMQMSSPEDLIEIALGVLEDELENAERLQQILQRMGNR
jgi:hypothetical protein